MVGQVQYFTKKKFKHVQVRFGRELVWGGGIQVLQTTAYPTWNNNERHYYLEVKDKIS